MIGFDFDELEESNAPERMQKEVDVAARLGPHFEALSAASNRVAWCGSGLVVDGQAEPVVIHVDTSMPINAWGTGGPHEYPFSACGVFWPLRDAPTLRLDVTFTLTNDDLPLSGTAKQPLFFRHPRRKEVPLKEGLSQKEDPWHSVLSKPLFLQYGWRKWRPGMSATARWRILDPDAHWLLEAHELSGQWVVKTELAEETDFRIVSACGFPSADVEASMAAPGPLVQRPLALPRFLECHIISLKQKRQTVVERLIFLLHKTSPHLRALRFEAWDTRPLRGTQFEAELVRRRIVAPDKQTNCAPILGCALSHSELWYQFLESDHAGPWVVMEDDAVLNDARPVTSILNTAVRSLEDPSVAGRWDVALLGCVGTPGTKSLTQIQKVSQFAPGLWGPVPFFIGTWGYMISRVGAQRALAELWADPKGLQYDVDICLSNAGGEGRMAISLTVPNVVLHPGIQGTGARNVISFTGYEYYLHGSRETAATTRFDRDSKVRPALCERLVESIECRVRQYRELVKKLP